MQDNLGGAGRYNQPSFSYSPAADEGLRSCEVSTISTDKNSLVPQRSFEEENQQLQRTFSSSCGKTEEGDGEGMARDGAVLSMIFNLLVIF